MSISKDFVMKNLDAMYPNAECELVYHSNFELLVAVILSAQCTDKRVNMVCSKLFEDCNKPEDFVNISLEELEKRIKPCGFYHNKALSLKSASYDIIEKFGGEVPSKFEDLISLRGVGRKTANVIISQAFKGDAFAVDTHVLRVSNRLGLVKTSNPDICEANLRRIFPQNKWSKMHYQMVLFGRYTCKAIKPNCRECKFSEKCKNARLG